MFRQKTKHRVVGIDVGGSRKGFHAVALEDGVFLARRQTSCVAELTGWCRDGIDARLVAIDAPCRWRASDGTRPAERQLLAQGMNVPYMTAQFFGGTGLLIIVGVTLDTMRQVETHLLQRHYDGFLRRGKIRGRFERTAGGSGSAISSNALVWIWTAIGIIVIAGTAAYLASGN